MPHRDHLDEVAQTHARLLDSLASISDEQLREASRLPGWTRDMLIAHLRFGAEAAIRGVEGLLRGTATVMYPGGDAQRAAEINSGAGRPARELVAELADACERFETVFAGLPADAWDAAVQTRRGPVPVREVLLQRWLDAEVHHVDLDIGYERDQWPATLVDAYLPGTIGVLPALRKRPDADVSVSGSWHLHRTDAPGEWTVVADGPDVNVIEGHSKGDCALRGTGADLLAYLLGRSGLDAVEVFGDGARAAALKTAFPGP